MKSEEEKKKNIKKRNLKDKDFEKLEKYIEELTAERDELFNKLQRLSADYANFQKRAPKQIADSVAYEKKAIIKSLLPSLDNFDHALKGARTAESVDSVAEGIQMVFDHMIDALRAHGVEIITALGRQFDPSIHEALMQKADPEHPDNMVLEEYQKGYKVNDQVIRPSKVIVNKLPAEETAEETEAEPAEEPTEEAPKKKTAEELPEETEETEPKEETNE